MKPQQPQPTWSGTGATCCSWLGASKNYPHQLEHFSSAPKRPKLAELSLAELKAGLIAKTQSFKLFLTFLKKWKLLIYF